MAKAEGYKETSPNPMAAKKSPSSEGGYLARRSPRAGDVVRGISSAERCLAGSRGGSGFPYKTRLEPDSSEKGPMELGSLFEDPLSEQLDDERSIELDAGHELEPGILHPFVLRLTECLDLDVG